MNNYLPSILSLLVAPALLPLLAGCGTGTPVPQETFAQPDLNETSSSPSTAEPAPAVKGPQYRLQIDPDIPTMGNLEMILAEPLDEATEVMIRRPRGIVGVVDPRCEDLEEPLEGGDGSWIAPKGCSVIAWETPFAEVAEPWATLSHQRNLYYPGRWWLFTERDSLFRLAGDPQNSGADPGSLCANFAGEESCQAVPKPGDPPVMMALGTPDHVVTIGETTLRFFAGHLPPDFALEDQVARWVERFPYFYDLALATQPCAALPDELDIVLLGIDTTGGNVGGAAGQAAVLANMPISDHPLSDREAIFLDWLVAHELAHTLRIETGPVWAGESLAQYYGYKWLEPSEAVDQLFEQVSVDDPEMGLLEAFRLVTEEEQFEHYELFYSQGAAFWRAVDDLIQSASEGEESLDDFLPLLHQHPFEADGQLPPEFLDAVGDLAGQPRLEEILDFYLIGPTERE